MKKIVCTVLSLLLCLSLFSCKNTTELKNEKYTEMVIDAFDTVTTVIAFDSSKDSFDSHFSQFKQDLEQYDKLFSIYKEYDGITNLYEINAKAKDSPVKADKEIIELLKFGVDCYSKTNGAVNICMGSVLKLWHDAREVSLDDPTKAYIPDEKALSEAAKHTDINNLVIDEEASTVFFKDGEMSLDVGAIAKGYTAQKIADKIKADGVWKDFVISLGGNVVASGYKSRYNATNWNIEIENPSGEETFEVLSVTDKSVVTSGDYQRYFTVDGKTYCHIIDPKTNMPANNFKSVSIVCDDSALADALSTALFILSRDEGMKLIESLDGVEAMWADAKLNKTYSSGFGNYILK